MTIQLEELRGFVSEMYSDVARFPRAQFHFEIGRSIMEKLGYPAEMLDGIPSGASESYAGVGYHFGLEAMRPGERVLDVGAGAGSDAFCASFATGAAGEVIGLDMTDAMLAKAHHNLEAFALRNVSFIKGHAEQLPFADASFDRVISNGVFNLSPEKSKVFGEVARVLVPKGKLMFSDLVTGIELPASVRENCELWAECIGGAEQQDKYLQLIENAGLKVEKVVHNDYRFTQASTIDAAAKFQVRSIGVLACKLEAQIKTA